MTDQLISFETAKLAKEKEFLEPTINLYDISNRGIWQDEQLFMGDKSSYDEKIDLFAPTQSLLQRWLREKHGIHIYIKTTPSFDEIQGNKWKSSIKYSFKSFKWTTGHYYLGNTYEEVLEQGLQEALKLIEV